MLGDPCWNMRPPNDAYLTDVVALMLIFRMRSRCPPWLAHNANPFAKVKFRVVIVASAMGPKERQVLAPRCEEALEEHKVDDVQRVAWRV